MRNFMKEFRTFATRGNVFDLAVGIIIGGAFGKIVTSFVNDLFMPFMSLLLGKLNLAQMKFVLVAAEGDKPELSVMYGNFIQTTIDFVLIAFVVFLMIKGINRFKKKEEEKAEAAPTPTAEVVVLGEIRDLLKRQHEAKS